MFTFKVDKEIELALANPAYAERMFKLIELNREYLSQWLAWPPHTKEVSHCKESARNMLHAYAEGKSMSCYIIFQDELVGTAGFNKIDHSLKRVEIGYWLSHTHQGRGIITRACRKLCEIAFEELLMEKVQISVAEGNKPSRAVCEQLEMQLEGIITNAENLNGRIVNHAVYGLYKSKT